MRAGGGTVPSWVPATAWHWTDVPNSTWTNHVKNDGTGVAPQITALDPGPNKSYTATWEYSGPVYSRKHHEFWHFGGGHAATTINLLTRINLGKDTPDVTMVSAPTSESDRRAWCFDSANLLSTAYFPVDGKPYSPHSYWNNLYSDSRDEFISFGIAGIASSSDGTTMGGGTLSFNDIAGHQRDAAAWRAEDYYLNIPTYIESAYANRGPRLLSADGQSIYYWPDGFGLRRYDFATNSHNNIGGTTLQPSGALTLMPDGTKSLHVGLDSTAGYGVKLCDLSTGVQTSVTTTGDALPAGLRCYGVEYVATLNKYVAVWVNTASYNAPAATISTLVVATIELTGPTTAVAVVKTTTGTGPTVCASYRGMGFDPAFGCLLLAMSPTYPVKALKVA